MISDSVYIQSLVDYIDDVKPYSRKLVDVSVEYEFTDSMNVHITDAHTIDIIQSSYWVDQFSYDGTTLNYQLPAILFPRSTNKLGVNQTPIGNPNHKMYNFVVGVDEAQGIIDRENPTTTLQNAFRVRGNHSIEIFANGNLLVLETDYRIVYEDDTPLGPANSVFQFLSGKNLASGTVLYVDVSYFDRLFIGLSNYNSIGVARPGQIGSVWNNNTTFVPYQVGYNVGDNPSQPLYDRFGGSFNVDPNAAPVIPAVLPDPYDNPGYDVDYYDGQYIDPSDYTNGIANFDTRPFDGQDLSDFTTGSTITEFVDNTYVISGFITDQYNVKKPVLTPVAGRTGMLIGTVNQQLDVNNNPFYVFQFNQAYLNAFVPVGTFVTLIVDQREAISELINVSFQEACFIGDQEMMNDMLNYDDSNTQIVGYDESPYDSEGPLIGSQFIPDPSNPSITEEQFYTEGNYDASTIPMNVYEALQLQSTSIDLTDVINEFSISIPDAIGGTQWSVTIGLNQQGTVTTEVIINHFFGDQNPAGPHADQGGVIVTVTGATPVSITNPYINNSPTPLFNTTVLAFSASSNPITIAITKP